MSLAVERLVTAMQIAATATVTVAIGWLVPRAVAATGSPLAVAGAAGVVVAAAVLPALLPESLLVGILAATMLLNDEMALSTGLPSLGINVVDLLVLSLTPWLLLRALAASAGGTRRARDVVWLLLLVILALGTLFLGVGLVRGASLRTGLRDYRLFVYLPITYLYAVQAFRSSRPYQRLLIAWYVISAAEFVAVGTGWLVLHWDVGKRLVAIPTYPGESIWHFVGVWSYLPLFVSLAYLLRPSRLTKLEVGFHGGVVAVLTLIATLSFSRGLWMAITVAVLFTAAMARGQRIASSFRLVLIAVILTSLVVTFLASRDSEALAGLTARAVSVDAQSDVAIVTRVIDMRWTLGEILRNPFGYGLGMGDIVGFSFGEEQLGGALHMGYIWMAYRSGVLAPILFVAALWLALRRARRAISAIDSQGDSRSAWLYGAGATLVALALTALNGTTMAYFMATPYFGLLLGMLTHAAAPTPGLGACRVPRAFSARPADAP